MKRSSACHDLRGLYDREVKASVAPAMPIVDPILEMHSTSAAAKSVLTNIDILHDILSFLPKDSHSHSRKRKRSRCHSHGDKICKLGCMDIINMTRLTLAA